MRVAGMESTKPANVQMRTLPGKLTEPSGYDAVVNWLSLSTARTSPVKLVAAHNDNMAMGARRAFAERMTGDERERWSKLPYSAVTLVPVQIRNGCVKGSWLPPSSCRLPPAALWKCWPKRLSRKRSLLSAQCCLLCPFHRWKSWRRQRDKAQCEDRLGLVADN